MWNYRIVKHREGKKTYYGLHEVYYEKKRGKGKFIPYLWDPDPEVIGDTPAELIEALGLMLRGATKDMPILKYQDMPGAKKKRKKT